MLVKGCWLVVGGSNQYLKNYQCVSNNYQLTTNSFQLKTINDQRPTINQLTSSWYYFIDAITLLFAVVSDPGILVPVLKLIATLLPAGDTLT